MVQLAHCFMPTLAVDIVQVGYQDYLTIMGRSVVTRTMCIDNKIHMYSVDAVSQTHFTKCMLYDRNMIMF